MTSPNNVGATHESPLHLHPDHDAERLLIDLVAIPSPSTQERAAVDHLVAWMAARGADAHIDQAGNAIGVFGTGSRTLLLLGHIDTVGGFPPVRVEDRILYGRGSVDAKGSLCAFAAAAASAAIPAGWRVIVVGAVEEEAPSSKGARHIATTYIPDLCLIGEPSAWDRITLGYKGRLLIEWRWRGGLAHSAGEQPSAGERAFAYWEYARAYVNAYNADRAGIFARLDATIQRVNTSDDGVYGSAELLIGLRLPPDADPDQIARDLAPDDDATIHAYGAEHAFTAARDSQISRLLRGAIRSEGGRPAFVVKTGTSDMNIVGRAWNCPIATYGAGDSALDHTPHEHIDLDEYGRAVRVLTRVIQDLG